MKNRFLLALSLMALSLPATFGQPLPGQPAPVPPGYRQAETPTLTKFSLDFPGGTPRQLIAAIEKAMGKPVNAIIPAEHADVKLPPLKMNNVDVQQLFLALERMSQKTEPYVTANNYGGLQGGLQSVQQIQTAVGFRTAGAVSDDAIWYFYVTTVPKTPFASPVIPKVCRFYPLTSYLDRGLTVDDITTAIQTGWKMLGDKETPAISFHKETKLLIAVGEAAKLETIDAVLKALLGYAPPTGDNFTDRLNSLMQNSGSGIPPSPAQLAPLPAKLPPLPDPKFPRTLRPPGVPGEKTNSGN